MYIYICIYRWVAGNPSVSITLNFYIDGEESPSITIDAATACGAPINYGVSPLITYSSMYFSKGAKTTGWSNKIPIPFSKSVKVTFEGEKGQMFWGWIRGVTNVSLLPIFGLNIPNHARLEVQKITDSFDPLTFVDIVNVPAKKQGLGIRLYFLYESMYKIIMLSPSFSLSLSLSLSFLSLSLSLSLSISLSHSLSLSLSLTLSLSLSLGNYSLFNQW